MSCIRRPHLIAPTLLLATLALTGCRFDPSGISPTNENSNVNTNANSNNNNAPTCGNDEREAPEVCDGADLDGEDCASQGYDTGTLACAGDCLAFDITNCSGTGPVCGDDVRQGAEVCDGTDVGTHSCTDEGFYGGTLGCLEDCSGYDASLCTGTCGDGVANGPELCDDLDLAGQSCQTQGFHTGNLVCDGDCMGFDTAGCSGFCGDGVANGPEECDGSDLGGANCATLGCHAGALTCTAACTHDLTSCFAGHDEDADGEDDNCDNCPTYANAPQSNGDGDGLGDVCEDPHGGGILSQITAFEPFLAFGSFTVESGTWTSGVDEVLATVGPAGGNYLHSTVLPNVDYSVETTFRHDQPAVAGNNYSGLLFAWNGTPGIDLTAYACGYNRENGFISLWRYPLGGNWVALAQGVTTTTATDGQWRRLRVYRQGGTVACLYDDEAGGSGIVMATGAEVWPDMSGLTGLRNLNETTAYTSFVLYQ